VTRDEEEKTIDDIKIPLVPLDPEGAKGDRVFTPEVRSKQA